MAEICLERNFTNALILINPPYEVDRAIPGKRLIGWQQPVIHNVGNYPTNTWSDLGAQLVERQNDLDGFRKLIASPTLDFGYDYSNAENYESQISTYLVPEKYAIQWLQSSELCHLHYGKTTEACYDVRAMLALVKGNTQDRFIISQLIRLNLARMSADATWDILHTTNVSDEELTQLQ